MAKNLYEDLMRLSNELARLQQIRNEIDALNNMRRTHKNVIPISPQKYSYLLTTGCLDNDAFYYVFKEDVGQYIDGYVY